jgi:hypothetical protein
MNVDNIKGKELHRTGNRAGTVQQDAAGVSLTSAPSSR